MSGRVAVLLRHVGQLVHIPGLLAVVSLPVAWVAGEGFALPALGGTAAASLSLGRLLVLAGRRAGAPDTRDAMACAGAAWLAAPVVAAVPFLLIGRSAEAVAAFPAAAVFARPENALFEAFSGLTSTGLTMTSAPSGLPRTLQWWRSLLQWVGGLGVVVLMLAVLRSGGGAHRLYRAEAREEKILPTVRSTVQMMLRIYVLLTVAAVGAQWLAGAPPWQALNHGMTAIATGGFTITDDSAAGLGIALQIVLLATMVVGATSFAALDRTLRLHQPLVPWREGQHRLLLLLLAAGALALWAQNRLDPPAAGPAAGALASAFQWISALCTAGFQSADLAAWGGGAHLLLVLAMVLGGAAGSTCGGVKLSRAYMIYKGLVWRYRSLGLTPHEVPRHEVDGEGIRADQATRAVEASAILMLAWLAVLFGATVLLLHVVPDGVSVTAVMLEVASAQGNVGLSAGVAGPDLPASGKLLLMGVMWIGRLEILPVLMLLMPALRSRRR